MVTNRMVLALRTQRRTEIVHRLRRKSFYQYLIYRMLDFVNRPRKRVTRRGILRVLVAHLRARSAAGKVRRK